MQFNKIKITLVFLLCLLLGFEIWRLRTGPGAGQQTPPVSQRHKPDFVLLPESEVASYAPFFPGPQPHLESWEPTVGDIDDLNSNLSQIATLSDKDPDASRHIDAPYQYYRQYLAVVVNGKKTIFVNAMCRVEPGKDWRKHLAIANDGGKCYWHAIYDPETQMFSNLMVNGVA
jgi:hypothetical protein